MMRMPEPSAWGLPFNPAAVPPALQRFPRWVVWLAAFSRPGKVDKHPRIADQPTVNASTTNPSHWGSYRTACAAVRPPYAGVGYVLTVDAAVPTLEHLAAIDLDHCIDDQGAIAPHAQAIVDSLKYTYWERSPSGTGLRGFFACALPGESIVNHAAGVEIYDGSTARYVTVTGQHLPGTGRDVATVDPLTIANLFETYAAEGKSGTQTVYADMPELVDEATAATYLQAAIDALPARLAAFLATGEVEGYPSRSEATFAVCVALYGAGYSDVEVFTALHASPHTWQMALEHRSNKEHKAFAFLWRECCRARARAAPAPLDFDDLGPAPQAEAGPIFSPAIWQGTDAPAREWLVDGYIPRREVTLFMGSGGTGKSLSMLQLQTSMALGARWLGLPTFAGRSLGIYCEDKRDELQRRQEAINAYYLADHSDLANMLLWPRSAADGSLLMTFDNRDQGVRTKFAHEVVRAVTEHRPDLLILDTLADFFGGNENSRGQVTQFLRMLSHIAERLNLAIVICGHPSAAGQQSGDGSSGSTAWSNAVRSRLYLHREKDGAGVELNPNVRVLSKQKANYSTAGDKLRLAWVEGVFRYEHEPSAESFFQTSDEEAQAAFLAQMAEFEKADRFVSTSKHGAYGPREFAKRLATGAESEKSWCAKLEAAMAALLKAKRIEEVAGRPGRSARLVRVIGN